MWGFGDGGLNAFGGLGDGVGVEEGEGFGRGDLWVV